MDNPRFDIYLTGRLAPGLTNAAASERLAQLFRSTPEAMANLLTGKPQLLKRSVDQATAVKYREALQRAGLETAIRQERTETATASPPAAATPAPTTAASTGLSIAPVGTDVLSADERAPTPTANIDTGHIHLETAAATTSGRAVFGAAADTPAPTAGPRYPAHTARAGSDAFTLAPAEGDLLRPEEKMAVPAIVPAPPLTLAEPGALLETLQEEVQLLAPDISTLALAPEGGELLTAAEKPLPKVAVTPDISHLKLSDSGS